MTDVNASKLAGQALRRSSRDGDIRLGLRPVRGLGHATCDTASGSQRAQALGEETQGPEGAQWVPNPARTE